MRHRIRWLVLLGWGLWGSAGAQGQAGPVPAIQGRVGDWVTYRLLHPSGRASFWRMAVVGEARDNLGRDAVWVELEFGQTEALEAPLAQMKMLIARHPADATRAISRLWVGVGFEQPQEVSPEALSGYFLRSPLAGAVGALPAPSDPSVQVRTESAVLQTRVGRLAAQRTDVVRGGTRVASWWVSSALPVLGLARVELARVRSCLEVQASGHDARPRMRLPDGAGPAIPLRSYNGDLLSQAPEAGEVQ